MSLSLKEHRVSTSPQGDSDGFDTSESTGKDILEFDIEDEVLALKTRLVNNKLFFLNGFGYAVDSLLTMVQGVTGAQAFRELATASSYVNAGVVAQNVGLLVGALFWGFGADILGRRLAFNLTLWITSVAMAVAGAAPNFPFLGAFLALSTFGSGGNLILDPTVLLEFLPGDKQWVVTALAGCDGCGWSNNAGWRYTMFTCGALVFVLSILRVTVVRLVETPKFLLTAGRDADLVKYYQDQARKYNRPCSLTLEKLESCGQVRLTQREGKTFILSDIRGHVEGLFVSRKITLSTILIWLSWAITGLAYPLFYVFLPAYLSTRVPGKTVSQFETYRNLTLTTISGIPGSLIAGYLVSTRLGRKYTMFIGALASMALFFGITGIKTDAQNVGISCAISCGINIYYSTLYAYTAEVFPSAHRATGSGIAVAFNRLMGIVSAFVASSGNTATAVPLYVCAALFGGLALIAALFPFEPNGRRSS
ncbi:major facilitator superfamily domain-containing protein [Fusarium solani]|uniref:Major facilitator superfamily domain-containing protein n=1 Tax=Fusarium solani TaxID=169388 RepID=A0A9P9JV12_FUSSL|nr:major facilitator superfamily domain-containing protein [Fusarium solani]KAH7234326.1 major facilitator superfamily domain-containing protein [Fusarium solani]